MAKQNKKLYKIKIWHKLLFSFILVSLVPMIFLSSYLIYSSQNMIMKQNESQLSLENKRVRSILFNITYLATNISDTILNNIDFNIIINSDNKPDADISDLLQNFNLVKNLKENYTELYSINVYSSNPNLASNGTFITIDEKINNSNWYKNFVKSSNNLLWMYDDNFGNSNLPTSLILLRKIPLHKSKDYAILVISISDNYLKLMLNNKLMSSILSIDNTSIFYSENRFEKGEMLIDLIKNVPLIFNKTNENYYKNEKVLTFSSSLTAYKGSNTFQIITIDKNGLQNLNNTLTITISMIAISIIIPIILILFFSFNLSHRIITVSKQMGKVANGDFNIIDQFKGNDELAELFKDIKVTITKIQGLTKEIYEEKLENQKLENIQQKIQFEMLASQINPHFLYNTLETIRMKLVINNEVAVAQIVKRLGQFMRHNLEASNTLVTLQSELDYIKIYMEIQQFRFGSRVSYHIKIDQHFKPESYKILPLLLQPIVENALIHGVEDKKTNCTINIEIIPTNDLLIITIIDNGKGISQERLQYIRNSLTDSTSIHSKNHIGMNNVLQRIVLYYGSQYGLTIDSKEDTFTKVTITLPLEKEKFYEYNNR